MKNNNNSVSMESYLTESALLKKAGENIYRRGRTYWKRGKVASLQESLDGITAQVQGGEVYQVSLWVNKKKLRGECSCPAAKGGRFCKHSVAVGLVWLVRNGHEISDEPVCPFKLGNRIIYARDLLGTVSNIEEVDDETWVVVNFDAGECQRLALSYANLRLATEMDEEAGHERIQLMTRFLGRLVSRNPHEKKTPTRKVKALRVYTQQKSDADNTVVGASTCGLVGPFAFPFEWTFERNRSGRKSSRKPMRRLPGLKGVPLYVEAVPPPLKRLRYMLRELGERVCSHQYQIDEAFFSLFASFPTATDDTDEVILDLTQVLEEQSCSCYGTRKFINDQRNRFYKNFAELQQRAIANGRYFPMPNILRACIHRTKGMRMEMGFTEGFLPGNQLYMITFPTIEVRERSCATENSECKRTEIELIGYDKSINVAQQTDVTGITVFMPHNKVSELIYALSPEQQRFAKIFALTVKKPAEIFQAWQAYPKNSGNWLMLRTYLQFLDLSDANVGSSYGVSAVRFIFNKRWELYDMTMHLGETHTVNEQVNQAYRSGQLMYPVSECNR